MNRINKILNHKEFQMALQKNKEAEKERFFCKHGLEHLLDVARIAYIMSLEQQYTYSKDIIYAMALLHDIGRFREYEGEMSHEEASVILAKEILKDSGYDTKESGGILNAIGSHRQNVELENSLNEILYKADKLSRNCFACEAKEQCYWSEEKKNKGIFI